MTNAKSTKHALLTSVMALFLCFTMLLGTTFAWFTDTVVSNNNIITAGNLDVELYYQNDETDDWTVVNADTNIFKDTLWEPGHTEVVYFKVVNAGTLAFKYHLGINVVSETIGTNVNGEKFKLSNYIEFGAIETDTVFANRDAARAAVTDAKIISAGYSKGSALTAKEADGASEEYVALVVYMPETVGNEANYKTGTDAPSINLGINLVATQYTNEDDSYGNDYDTDSLPVDVIATPENIEAVLAAAKPGDVIGLADGEYYDMSIVIPCDDITLVSNTAKANHVNVNGKKNVKLIGITFDASAPVEVKDPKGGRGVFANITSAEGSKGAENLQIINCKFVDLYGVSTNATHANYCPITVYDRQRSTGASNNITIDGCTFDTNAAYYIYMYYPGTGNGDIVIKNNIFGNANTTLSTGNAVYVGNTKNNVTVVNNTVINSCVTVTPHNNASCTYSLKVSVADNNFINTTGEDMPAINLRNFYNLPKCNTYVEGNIANYGLSEFKPVYIDSDYECYDIAANTDLATDADSLQSVLTSGKNVDLIVDVFVESNQTGSNGYGATGATVKNGQILDGHGNSIGVDAWTTWDSAINTTGGTIKNVVINSGMRGIFMNGATADVYIDNVIIDGTVYTFNSDAGSIEYGVYISNSTLNGWTSYSNVHKEVVFDNCNFGEGQGYAFLRAYNSTEFKNCHFDAEFEIEVRAGAAASFENCYYGDTLITAENIATIGLLYETDSSLVTVK